MSARITDEELPTYRLTDLSAAELRRSANAVERMLRSVKLISAYGDLYSAKDSEHQRRAIVDAVEHRLSRLSEDMSGVDINIIIPSTPVPWLDILEDTLLTRQEKLHPDSPRFRSKVLKLDKQLARLVVRLKRTAAREAD